MIINLFNSKYSLWWVLFHILLGLMSVFNNTYIIVWFYFVIGGTIYQMGFSGINKPLILVGTMVYIGAFELLARMTKCSPIIPWEASKYLFAILSFTGILISNGYAKKKWYGSAILLLLLPSVFIDKSEQVDLSDIVFNIMGLVNIGLGLILFSSVYIKKSRFYDLIRLMVFPCLSILTYTFIKTPDISEINFSMGALNATSGNFGSNQVSTVLGLGFFLMAIAWILNLKITNSRIIDGLLATLFLIQGLFTFSRGGVIGGGLGIFCFLYILIYKSDRNFETPSSVKKYFIPAILTFTVAVLFTNELTKGNLFLRYQGETTGTLLGTKDKDISTLTSGRDVIFLSDIEIWSKNPILGNGAGSLKYLRSDGENAIAHIEFSRLLAENGLIGLIIFLLLLYSGYSYFNEKDSIVKALKISFSLVAIFTTFHSATRTFITPLLISICALNVKTKVKTNDPLPGK